MKFRLIFFFLSMVIILLTACKNAPNKNNHEEQVLNIQEKVDTAQSLIAKATRNYNTIVLDHHRMAKDVGVYTPPSIANIVSDPKINSEILSKNDQIVALDLPFKILCYTEADTSQISIAYTSSEFIDKRHSIKKEDLLSYKKKMNSFLSEFERADISITKLDKVDKGYGIIKIQSDFDFVTTIENLKKIVNAQTDTKWFGEIDFTKEAKNLGTEILPTTLLLFGGPGPGGKAMQTTPKIGLDAFCQKLLVFENKEGVTWIAFNDIVAFSELYYKKSTKPQKVINKRLAVTFNKAVKKQ